MKTKAKTKKLIRIRRRWAINPTTRVKDSARLYSRRAAGVVVRKLEYEG